MAPRIFISFAKEDIRFRDFFVAQARNGRTPFKLVDMSVQEPFDSRWKTRCRERIKECDGFIALLSKKTHRATGARWEMQCAYEEGLPILAVHIYANAKGAIPPELEGCRVIEWRWHSIAKFIDKVNSKRSALDRFFDFLT